MSIEMNNFLQAMAEAKQAIDAMPEMKRELEHLRRQTHIHGETIANRELHIHNLKQSEMALTQKLRSVEAERDEAMFRTLEGEEKVQALLSHLQQSVQASLALIAATEGRGALVVVTQSEQQELAEFRVHQGEADHTIARLSYDCDSLRSDVGRLVDERSQLKTDLYATQTRYENEIASLKAYIGQHEPKDESGQSAGFQTVPTPASASDPIPAAGAMGETQVELYQSYAKAGDEYHTQLEAKGESADTPTAIAATQGSDGSVTANTASERAIASTTHQLDLDADAKGYHADVAEKEVQAQPEGPFASSSIADPSQTAGGDVKDSASSSQSPSAIQTSTDDTWPIFSRASHNS